MSQITLLEANKPEKLREEINKLNNALIALPETVENTVQSSLASFDAKLSNETNNRIAADVNASNALTAEINRSIATDNALQIAVNDARAIAEGRLKAKVFATESELNAWIAVPTNAATLNIGDNLFITSRDVPDYWWDGTQPQILETEKVDLADYLTADEIKNLLEAKADKTYVDEALGDIGSVLETLVIRAREV